MRIRNPFHRISVKDPTWNNEFVRANPDCPGFLREAYARNQAGQQGFGPKGAVPGRNPILITVQL